MEVEIELERVRGERGGCHGCNNGMIGEMYRIRYVHEKCFRTAILS